MGERRVASIDGRNAESSASQQRTDLEDRMPACNKYGVGFQTLKRRDDRCIDAEKPTAVDVVARVACTQHDARIAGEERHIPGKGLSESDALQLGTGGSRVNRSKFDFRMLLLYFTKP